MGTYFNPSNESFESVVRSEIYIDKTGLLIELNKLLGTEKKCVALSHARRFGKSQAAGMIDAYYSLGSDSRELFSDYEISKASDYENHLNKYNVIHIDASTFADKYKEDLVENMWRIIYEELKSAFQDIMDMNNPIATVLSQVYEKSGRKFVIIIDEWDCVVRNHSDRPDLVHKYLQFLHTLFKSEESKRFLALAYITGILPIKKIKDESALNNFSEHTMIESDNLTRFFGFTDGEVEELCARYNMDYEQVKTWYNGYVISGVSMYNPNSVYNAMINGRLDSYWKNTSSFESINDLISLNFEGLKEDILTMLSGGRVGVDADTFQNDFSIIDCKDDALTALVHMGYLAYDNKFKEVYIPNYEVALAYKAALKKSNFVEVAKAISICEDLLKATIRRDAKKVAEYIEIAHDSYSSIIKYNDENSVSSVIQLAYFTAPAYYNIVRELPSGKGFADFAFIPRKDVMDDFPAMIIEVKWNKSAESAIDQIKRKEYAGKLKGYGNEVLLVGINYSINLNKDNKHHDCIIESVVV